MTPQPHHGRPMRRRHSKRLKEGGHWPALAVAKLREYRLLVPNQPFAVATFRAWALAHGLPTPASRFAWGALPRSVLMLEASR